MTDDRTLIERLTWFCFWEWLGLRYAVIRRADVDHAVLAAQFVSEQEREEVAARKMAPHWQWRWRWQRRDGSPRWRRD